MASGYVPEKTKAKVRIAFRGRCSYCLASQEYVYGIFEIEHILPVFLGGTNEEENLCIACRLCNSYKGIQTVGIDPFTHETQALFNPRLQSWKDHFCWSRDGIVIVGITAIGRATTEALKLNNDLALQVRRSWVTVGWHPPED
jgi:hypothetical protein